MLMRNVNAALEDRSISMGLTNNVRDGDDDPLMTSIEIDALWVVLDSLSVHADMIVYGSICAHHY